MSAYYNEHDSFAAAWLRELIKDNLIAPGEVDERDIRDVKPDDLRPFRQCHFFAGIGIWSAALRGAGWEDERSVWTGSCPCQPFSAAGGRKGFADERHLWPAFYHLIAQCRPDVVLGEQVAKKDGLAWFDLVSADMDAAHYAGGAIDLCAAGFGAPHIRQRLYFVWLADANNAGSQGWRPLRERPAECAARARGVVGGLGRADSEHERRRSGEEGDQARGDEGEMEGPDGQRLRHVDGGTVEAGRLADAYGRHSGAEGLQRGGEHGQWAEDAGDSAGGRPGPVNGFWRNADWLLCRDPDGPKWRAVEPGSFPLAHGIANRVGTLRGAGNAINKEVAQGFIGAVMEAVEAMPEQAAA